MLLMMFMLYTQLMLVMMQGLQRKGREGHREPTCLITTVEEVG